VLGFVVGAAQAELAGPLTRARDAADAAARIGSVAGATYPHIVALSKVAMQTTVEEDFDRGLRMLLDGIATRRPRTRR
jgi:Tetracyclin repressor-like, C-terminal domain